MKLYYTPGTCSLASHIVLREADLAFDLEKVDLATGKTESGGDIKSVNPNGYVPVLALDDGETVTEGPAIVQFLADKAPDKALAPAAGTLARTRVQEFLNFTGTELHNPTPPCSRPIPLMLKRTRRGPRFPAGSIMSTVCFPTAAPT